MFKMLQGRALNGPLHFLSAPPPPPIEVLYMSPPQKSKLLTPQEKRIKVPTHSPFRIYSKIKDASTQKTPPPPHHQSLFIHEIVSFYMVFQTIVFKTRPKYPKELLTIMLIQKLTLWIIRATMSHGVLEKPFPWNEVLKTFKLGSFLISQGILFHRTDPL